jgi:hypothetical protein
VVSLSILMNDGLQINPSNTSWNSYTTIATMVVTICAALELALLEVGWLKSLDEKFAGLFKV